MKKDKLQEQIEALNKANKDFDKNLEEIKRIFPKDNDIELSVYRIKNALNGLNRVIIKKLGKEEIDRAFNKLTKKFRKGK